MVASVAINGTEVDNISAPPYRMSLKNLVKKRQNTLSVQVTSTWFDRLVFDAGQSEEKRKTWTISDPDKNEPLRILELMGSVIIQILLKNKAIGSKYIAGHKCYLSNSNTK
ncbi:MAG: hypothetical protein ABIN24_03645 [Dyadobacter sp.]